MDEHLGVVLVLVLNTSSAVPQRCHHMRVLHFVYKQDVLAHVTEVFRARFILVQQQLTRVRMVEDQRTLAAWEGESDVVSIEFMVTIDIQRVKA